jgi:serine/threonine protein kinase
MGTVYLARHVDLGSRHAIKMISREHARDEHVIALFRREVESLRSVRHEAVIAYEGTIRDEAGRLYLVMEFADGPSLADVLADGPIHQDQAETLLWRIGDGLDTAHAKGIVHRDIAPDNIVLVRNHVADAKVIDFGIARNLQVGSGTLTGSAFAGKFTYASPEQLGMFGGQVDGRSDIYSFGLTLAAALGRPLDMGATPMEATHRREHSPELSAFEEPWRTRLTAMLQPDPVDRVGCFADVPRHPSPYKLTTVDAEAKGRSRPASTRSPAGGAQPEAPHHRRAQPAAVIRRAGVRRAAGPFVMVLLLVGVASSGWMLRDRLPFLASGEGEPVSNGAATQSVDKAGAPLESAQSGEGTATQTAASPALPIMRERVAHAFETPECARVSPRVTRIADGYAVELSGLVPDATTRARIRTAVSQVEAVSRVNDRGLAVRPPPFCTMLTALPPTGGVTAPAIRLNHPNGLYTDGERITIEIISRGASTRHVYVSYLDSEGTLLHLLPSDAYDSNKLAPGDHIELGSDGSHDGGVTYRAAKPYGLNLVLAVSSTQPLFKTPRPASETRESYLSALKAAIDRVETAGGRVDLAKRFLRTER